MNTRNKFALSAVAGLGLAAIAAPAMAADVVYQEPPAPQPIMETAPISTWAGPYLGAQIGYGFHGRVSGAGETANTDGWMGGVFGGYNFQDGQLVYGIEGDINYSDVHGSNPAFGSRTNVDGSIRGRIGAAVTDDILVYGTAGVAAENQQISSGGLRESHGHIGYTVGAGADVKLTEDVFARAEYRYTDYGSKTYDLPLAGTSIDSSNHRVTVGLGIKF